MIDLYHGLRNLSVGDEEETRIADMIDDIDDPKLRLAVTALVDLGEYTAAYQVAVRQEFLRLSMQREGGLSREHVEAGCREWVIEFNDEQGDSDESSPSTRAAGDEDGGITVEELMAVYDDIMVRLKSAAPAMFEAFNKAEDEKRDKDLPSDRPGGLVYFQALLDRYHAAVMADDADLVDAIDDEAHRLATKMNGGEAGILADANAPGSWLERKAAAKKGTVPRWGQMGEFTLAVKLGAWTVRIRFETRGLFGHGFSAHAVDWHLPFISPTGYQSFYHGVNWQAMPVDDYARDLALGEFTKDRFTLKTIHPEDQARHAKKKP